MSTGIYTTWSKIEFGVSLTVSYYTDIYISVGQCCRRTAEMQILHVSEPVYPVVQGGLGTHTHQMANRQAKQGHEVTVLGTNDEATSVDPDAYAHTLVLKNELFRLFGARVSVSALRWLRNHIDEYDIVHIHSHLFFTSNFASFLNRFSSAPPLLATNHGTYANLHPVLARSQFRLFGKPTYVWADKTICYNETAKEILTSVGVEDIEVVPNGINVDQFSPAEDRDITCGPIVWSGRMTERKGLFPTIKAMARIVDDYPELELHLYGDGEQRRKAEALVSELCIEGNVQFKGFVPQEQLLDQLKHSRLYVAPTDEYTFGRGIMEAISCGIPTFSTNLPIDDELGKAGIPITRNPDSIAETIRAYLQDPAELESVAWRGRQIIKKNHNFTKHIDRVTKICEAMVADQSTTTNVV